MADDMNSLRPELMIPSSKKYTHKNVKRLKRCLSDKPFSSNENRFSPVKKASSNIKFYKALGKENMDPELLKTGQSREKIFDVNNKVSRKPLQRYVDDIPNSDEDSLQSTERDYLFDSISNQGQGFQNHLNVHLLSKDSINSASTPPPSPTWNLKMLCTAVSPEIRRMQQEKENGFEEGRSSTVSMSSS
ncbi:unnamed protein product, partial [Lymnaea stagnalis]